MIRSFPIALRIAALGLATAAAGTPTAWPQGVAPPPVMTAVATPPARPSKAWYPRLAGVPVQSAGPATFVLAGTRYQKRLLLVSFFADTPQDRIATDLARFATDDVRPSSDGESYYLTLSSEGALFRALDLYNDLPEVHAAALVPEATSGSVAPTPGFGTGPAAPTPPSGSGIDTTAVATGEMPESLWPGDVNGDYRIDLSDAILVLKAAIGLLKLPPLEAARADIERKGKIDVGDAILTLGLSVGLGLPPPYGFTAP